MNVSVLTFKAWCDVQKINLRPAPNENRGGIVTKYLYVQKCFPDLHMTDDCNDPNLNAFLLIEPMFIEKEWREKLEMLKKHQGVKLLWAEEQTVIRWDPERRTQIFAAMDGLVACNLYQKQLIEVIAGKLPVYVLRSPIPELVPPQQKRDKRVIVVSKLGLQKNAEAIIEVFKYLPAHIEKVFIGNAGLWGAPSYLYDLTLEEQMKDAADIHITNASLIEVAEKLTTTSIYLSMTIYDVGSLAFLEAAMAGCTCMCWDYHPMYDEYESVIRFKDANEAIKIIEERLAHPTTIDNAMRNEIIQKHSPQQFITALQALFLEVYFYAKQKT